jgi:hypothetical protein
MKSVEDLRSIGRRLYGESWIGPMAKDLGVLKKSVQDWESGKNAYFDSQHWFWDKVPGLLKLAEARQEVQGKR